MSKSRNSNNRSPRRPRGKDRRIRVRSELRKQPDVSRIANTVIALALAQAEKEAQADAAADSAASTDRPAKESPHA